MMLRRLKPLFYQINIKISYLLLTVGLCCLMNPLQATTTIYKYIDMNGVLHLTNKPPKQKDKLLYSRSYLVKPYIPEPQYTFEFNQYPKKQYQKKQAYTTLIDTAALQTQIPSALLRAVVHVESNYNPKAVSPKGAVGLMQLMPATAKRYGVNKRTDPVANVYGGARYLKDLLTLFEHDVSLALAAYNAGEHAVKRYGNQIPPYKETEHYVKKVKQWYQYYQEQMSASLP
ncbi:MAG: transglycosylase SLT domain-containing protein [Pseudomonadota bacterium]|nr:transglycosylase SLT domain-containing protein [Pseudomonadota bacterium]